MIPSYSNTIKFTQSQKYRWLQKSLVLPKSIVLLKFIVLPKSLVLLKSNYTIFLLTSTYFFHLVVIQKKFLFGLTLYNF